MKKISLSKQAKLTGQKKDVEFQRSLLEALNSHTQMLTNMSARVVCLEGFLLEKNPEITPELLETRIELITDRGEGLIPSEIVARGDKVRVKITTPKENSPVNRMLIRDVGSGGSLPVGVEADIIGMKKGDTKSTTFPTSPEAQEILIKVVGIATVPTPTPKEVSSEKS